MFHGLARYTSEDVFATLPYYNTTDVRILFNPTVNATAESLVGVPFVLLGFGCSLVVINRKPYYLPAWVQEAMDKQKQVNSCNQSDEK
jgi:hypothetical protein